MSREEDPLKCIVNTNTDMTQINTKYWPRVLDKITRNLNLPESTHWQWCHTIEWNTWHLNSEIHSIIHSSLVVRQDKLTINAQLASASSVGAVLSPTSEKSSLLEQTRNSSGNINFNTVQEFSLHPPLPPPGCLCYRSPLMIWWLRRINCLWMWSSQEGPQEHSWIFSLKCVCWCNLSTQCAVPH